jgi:hypothetical protein
MLEEYGGSGSWPVPREMTTADIDLVVTAFAAAAERARAAGFDGVEVHAANGYLLDQFLTLYTNARRDEYGGDVANRIRLTARLVATIRDRVGGDFVIGVRLSQTKVNDLVYRWPGAAADAVVIFAAVADAGADYVHRQILRWADDYCGGQAGHWPPCDRQRRDARPPPGRGRPRGRSCRPTVDRARRIGESRSTYPTRRRCRTGSLRPCDALAVRHDFERPLVGCRARCTLRR